MIATRCCSEGLTYDKQLHCIYLCNDILFKRCVGRARCTQTHMTSSLYGEIMHTSCPLRHLCVRLRYSSVRASRLVSVLCTASRRVSPALVLRQTPLPAPCSRT